MITYTGQLSDLAKLTRWHDSNIGTEWDRDDYGDGTGSISFFDIETDEEAEALERYAHSVDCTR